MFDNTLFAVRHFTTSNNLKGIISGRLESPIVSLKVSNIYPKSFKKIYCSPSLRCRDTIARLIKIGLSFGSIEYNPLLLERDLGDLEGMTRAKASTMYPNLFYDSKLHLRSDPPGGENYQDFYNRVKLFVDYLQSDDPSSNVLICSHNQTLKILYFIVHDISPTEDEWRSLSFKNGEIVSLGKTNIS